MQTIISNKNCVSFAIAFLSTQLVIKFEINKIVKNKASVKNPPVIAAMII